MRKFFYSKPVYWFLYGLCRIFYPKKYLKGYYFNVKRMGFVWALKGITRRIFTGVPWPIGKTTTVTNWKNIQFHPDSLNVFQSPGCYFQAIDGKINIGQNVQIAPNVGIITTNHDVNNLKCHVEGKDVVLGDNCWIGMNSVILPGVILGQHTIVGAGAVVTRSIPEGNCLVVGVPAHVVRLVSEHIKGE